MIVEKLIFKVPYEVVPTFRPPDLLGSQLYYAKDTATPSLWNDQSPNAYNLTQGVAGQQPSIGVNTVDYGGINDVQLNTTVNPFTSHTLGVIYFSGEVTSGVNSRFINISNSLATTGRARLSVEYVSGKISIAIRFSGLDNTFASVSTFPSGYLYGYIKSTGTGYELMVNGVIQTLSFSVGSNNGNWLSFVGITNRISIGGIFTGGTVFYTPDKVNKIYYNNTALSAGDITNLNTFFSDPTKY